MFTQEESIEVPSKLVRKNSYALRVRGNSMIDGDIVVIEQSPSRRKSRKELSFELTKKK